MPTKETTPPADEPVEKPADREYRGAGKTTAQDAKARTGKRRTWQGK